MKVDNILQSKGTDVYAISPAATIEDAVAVLGARNIGAVIVKDDGGRVVGILSERDVVRRLGRDGAGVLAARVKDCMTPNPFTCDRETTVEDLMSEMTAKRIRHMPVVEDERLIGIVSIGDVVKRKIEATEREAEALKAYIAS